MQEGTVDKLGKDDHKLVEVADKKGFGFHKLEDDYELVEVLVVKEAYKLEGAFHILEVMQEAHKAQ